MDFAREVLGEEPGTDPVEALLMCVRLAAGSVAYFRAQLMEIEGEPSAALISSYRRALTDLSRFAKVADDAGAEERQLALTEEAANAIACAIERAAAPLELTHDEQAAFARRVGEELAALEAERQAA